MLFLLTAFALESDCKNTHFFSFGQNYFDVVVSKKADRREGEPNNIRKGYGHKIKPRAHSDPRLMVQYFW